MKREASNGSRNIKHENGKLNEKNWATERRLRTWGNPRLRACSAAARRAFFRCRCPGSNGPLEWSKGKSQGTHLVARRKRPVRQMNHLVHMQWVKSKWEICQFVDHWHFTFANHYKRRQFKWPRHGKKGLDLLNSSAKLALLTLCQIQKWTTWIKQMCNKRVKRKDVQLCKHGGN